MALDLTKFISLNSGVQELTPGTNSSAGAGDAAKIVALNASGLIDSSMLPPSSGLTLNPTPYTASTVTLTGSEDNYLIFNCFSNAIAVTLPAAAGNANKIYYLTMTAGSSADVLTINAAGSDGMETPDGNTNSTITTHTNNTPIGLMSDGVSLWYAFADNLSLLAEENVSTIASSNDSGSIQFISTVPVVNGGTGQSSLTVHDVLVGNGTSGITQVAPSATSGVPLVSQGSSSDPHFGTTVVAGGGTGAVTLTNHGVLLGQGTSAVVATSAGTSGQVLTSNGSSSDPTFQAAPYAFNTMSVTVSETIAAGAMINLWNNSGLNVRNADNTSTSQQAHGFALTGASSGAITVAVGSGPNTNQSGLTVGVNYFLGAAGAVTATAPSSSGDLVMPVGVAVSSTELQVILGQVTSIA